MQLPVAPLSFPLAQTSTSVTASNGVWLVGETVANWWGRPSRTCGGDRRKGTFYVKLEHSVCDRRDTLYDVRDSIDWYCAFHFGNWPVTWLMNKMVASFCIYTIIFAISGGTTGRSCCGHILRGLALYLLQVQSWRNNYTWKGEAMYCAVTFLLNSTSKESESNGKL